MTALKGTLMITWRDLLAISAGTGAATLILIILTGESHVVAFLVGAILTAAIAQRTIRKLLVVVDAAQLARDSVSLELLAAWAREDRYRKLLGQAPEQHPRINDIRLNREQSEART